MRRIRDWSTPGRPGYVPPVHVVVVGAGMAGLTAARRVADAGHAVTVVDKGRRPGGRMATKHLRGGARADHGAQFFTVRTEAFDATVARWLEDGAVREWCRGFGSDDGHPRYAATNGMAELAGRMAIGLDVKSSVRVDAVRPRGRGWVVTWPAGHGALAGSLDADAVVLTAPVPQVAALMSDHVAVPEVAYTPTISLLVALVGPSTVPAPGGVQLDDHPTWSWIGDNVAKGTSTAPAVTFHTRADVAAARWLEEAEDLSSELLRAASPWVGSANVVDVALHRWRYATPVEPHPERCMVAADGRVVFAGDAFGGPRVEGAFLSGLAAAAAIVDGNL